MNGNFLIQAAVFLAAAAIAAPIAKKLNISSVLGYLAAGVLIGPFGMGFVYEVYQVESILHIAEYGVILLLFLIGLELKPMRRLVRRPSRPSTVMSDQFNTTQSAIWHERTDDDPSLVWLRQLLVDSCG